MKNGVLLCLSGGGVRSVYELAFFEAVEKKLGRPFQDWADIVSAFSGGALTSVLSLVPNPPSLAQQINANINYFETLAKRKPLFGLNFWWLYCIASLFSSYFKTNVTENFLKNCNIDQGLKIKDLTKDVFIPVYNVNNEQETFYTRESLGETRLYEAAEDTAMLPVLFSSLSGNRDGGLGSTDLLLKALMYAKRHRTDVEKWTVVACDVLGVGAQDLIGDWWLYGRFNFFETVKRLRSYLPSPIQSFVFNFKNGRFFSYQTDCALEILESARAELAQDPQVDALVAHLRDVLAEKDQIASGAASL